MRTAALVCAAVLVGALAALPWARALLEMGGPANQRFALHELSAQLSEQYHLCVPLGWNPQPVAGFYYPAHSVEYRENGVWLHPYWLGWILRGRLSDPNTRVTYDVLNALVRAKLLSRSSGSGGYYYRVTMAAVPYYYENNSFGNNPDHLPYLCYSRVVPDRILISRAVNARAFRLQFAWHPGINAPWANDPFIRAHSVVLPPILNPATAVFSERNGTWSVQRLTTAGAMLPRPISAAAWNLSHE